MSGAQNAKLTQGFLSATARPRCGNCRFGKEDIADRMPPFDTRKWTCKRGGFTVTAGAICNKHDPDTFKGTPVRGATVDEGTRQ